jgi:septal ring factor EnvC (AmiA/AmiB activator)
MKFFKVFLFLFIILGTCKAFAQSSEELKKQREQLNQQLQRLQHDLEETSNNKKSTLRQLNLIKEQIEIREKKIKNIDSDIRLLDNQISDNTNEVHSLQSQLVQLKKEYAAMVLFAFRNQSAYNKLMFIFVAKDFNQAYMRLKHLQQIGSYRQRQAEYITGTQKDLNQKIVQLDETKKVKTTLLVDQEKEKANLGKQKKEEAQVVDDLSKHAKQVKQETAQTQRKLAAIDRAINNAVRREIEEAKRREEARIAAEEKAAAAKARADNKPVAPVVRKPAKTTNDYLTATPEAAKLSSDFLGNRGRLPWPVANGNYMRRFGTVYINGIKDENQGVSIKTNDNAPVRAVFEGEVLMVQDVSGTYTVVIRHGGYFTAYSNLKSVSVSRGQKVSTKQSLGTAATDPATGDAVIEFEVLKGEIYLDPAGWLAQN